MTKYNYPYNISFYKFLFNASAITKNPIPFHNQFFEQSKGDTFSIKPFFSEPIILTRNAEIAREILQKNNKYFEKSKLQTVGLSKYVGYGLLTSKGAYWLKQRRLIQPAFHKEKINSLISIIYESINKQVSSFKPNTFQELYPIINNLAFEVIAKTLFNYSADKNSLNTLQTNIDVLQKFVVKEIRQPHKKIWYTLNGSIKKHLKIVAETRAIIEEIIKKRKKSKQRFDDLLDMLLEAKYEDGTSMTNQQLIDEIIILFVAGHETTANALTFTLFLLANNPEKLNKAIAEAKAFNLKNLNIESFANLNYIKSCIEESMRLYPPAWITDRVALKDITVGKYTIKKGTIIGVSIYEIHRNKNYWQSPEAYKPERFNTNNRKKTNQHYLPFGAGPRLCIGNNFAMYEMMLTIATILKKFTIKTNTNQVQLLPLITLKPANIKMKFVDIK